MGNSGNISQSNQQENIPWFLRHRKFASLIISLLTFVSSLFFTDVLKTQPPYYDINLKLILNIAIAVFFWFMAQIVLAFIEGVIGGIYNLRSRFGQDVRTGIEKVTEITGQSIKEMKRTAEDSLLEIGKSLNIHKNTIAETHYTGFYRLLSDEGARANFEELKNML